MALCADLKDCPFPIASVACRTLETAQTFIRLNMTLCLTMKMKLGRLLFSFQLVKLDLN